MKKTTSLFIALLIAASLFGQVEPDKTFDFTAFGKKVYSNFSAGMDPVNFLPDNIALAFISSKTGRSIDELKAENELNKQYLSVDKIALKKENAGGQPVLKVEFVKVDHPQLTMGNIIITVGEKRIELRNCIQTNKTWVLGDYFGLEGLHPVRGKPVTQGENSIAGNAGANVPYHGIMKFNKDLIGKVLKGYYIKTDGGKINAAILCDEPNNLQSNDVELRIYKKAEGERDFTPENSNFDKLLSKSGLRAFFVADNLYIKAGNSWFILLDEAPVSRLAQIASSEVYKVPENVEKPELVGKPVRGYYIDNKGNKFNAVIKYQGVAQLQNMTSTFLVYKIAYNENGFTEDESNNFKTILMKSDVKEFNLGGNTYYKAMTPTTMYGEWRVKVEALNYSTSKSIYKTGEAPIGEAGLPLGFKNTMSKLTSDNTELSTKIANKEKGYTFLNADKVISEYNAWYLKQYPGKIKYVLSDIKTVTEESKGTSAPAVAVTYNNVSNTSNTNATQPTGDKGVSSAVSNANTNFGTMTDQDGNTYKTIKIGLQTWMAENMNVSKFRNGDLIPEFKTAIEWENAAKQSKPGWCYYEYDSKNGPLYGRLYNWYAVTDIRGFAPKGWHVPSDAEFQALCGFMGGEKLAGQGLKNSTGWGENGTGTNESGFGALPGGGGTTSGSFKDLGKKAMWWTSTEVDEESSWVWLTDGRFNDFTHLNWGFKQLTISVRCIKD
jgi:uncharacterized protein (TIGR02145 family)